MSHKHEFTLSDSGYCCICEPELATVMRWETVTRRVNACEELTAEDARDADMCIRLCYGWLESHHMERARELAAKLRAYANKLEEPNEQTR